MWEVGIRIFSMVGVFIFGFNPKEKESSSGTDMKETGPMECVKVLERFTMQMDQNIKAIGNKI
jgi:hypothetical protein